MATDVRLVQWNNFPGPPNGFRSWGKGISDALAAVGLTKLSGAEAAGQIDWATTPAPTSQGQNMGFEVWRFNDALQATSPVFIKVIYCGGQQLGATTPWFRPAIRFQVGTGVNAVTGALTGIVSNLFEAFAADWDGNAANTQNIYTSGANNRIAQVCAHDNAHPDFIIAWAITRTKNADGTDNGDGVIVQAFSASTYITGSDYTPNAGTPAKGYAQSQCVLFTGNQADTAPYTIYDGGPTVMLGQATRKTGIVGADTAVFPWLVPSSRGLENPAMSFASYWTTDLGNGAIVPIRMYGADHMFRCFGAGGMYPPMYQDTYDNAATLRKANLAAPGAGIPAGGAATLAMRWE